MGAALSTSTNGILVALEKPQFAPGDVVQGVVCLNVLQPIHTTGLYLKIKGFERTEWTTQHSRQVAVTKTRPVTDGRGNFGYQTYTEYETEHYEVRHSGLHTFFRVQVALGPAGVIPPGQHQFPFLTTLPHGLPASFAFASGRASGAIKYKIKAVCAQRGLLRPNLRHTQTLHVVPPLAASQPQGRRVTAEVAMCGCFSRGHAEGEVAVDGSVYRAGDVARLSLRVTNHSKRPFKFIKVKLMRQVHFEGTDGWKEGGNSWSDTQKVAGCQLPGWAAGEVECVREIAFTIPPAMEASVQGRLIKCRHWLQVKCEAGTFATALRLGQLPILAPLAGPQWLPSTLANWRPAYSGQPVVAQLPGAPPVPASYLHNQWWRHLATPLPPPPPPPTSYRPAAEPPSRAEARPAPTAAGAGSAAPPPMGSARSEPFPAPARGPAGAAWPPPMGSAPSAPLYPNLAAGWHCPTAAAGSSSGSGVSTPGTPSPAQSAVHLSA